MEIATASIDGFLAYWSNLHEVNGEIHSVFQRALNIKTSSGQLVSVLSMKGLDGPNTLVVELPQDRDFITIGLKSGMPVRLGREEAVVGERTLCLRLGRAQRWWPRLAGGMEYLEVARLRRNLNALLKTPLQGKLKKGLGVLLNLVGDMAAGRWSALERLGLNRLSRKMLPGIRDLLTGTLEHDETLLKRGLDQLLGLGTGLTPSGDDLLLGYLGTLNVVSRRVGGPEVGDVLEISRRHLRDIKNKTTFVSGNLLSYACQGRMCSPALAVIRALLFGTPLRVGSAAGDLMQVGASSGSEILLGILLALSLVPRLTGI